MMHAHLDRFNRAAQRVVTSALEQDELLTPRDIAYPGYTLADGWRLTLAVERDAKMLCAVVEDDLWTDRTTEAC